MQIFENFRIIAMAIDCQRLCCLYILKTNLNELTLRIVIAVESVRFLLRVLQSIGADATSISSPQRILFRVTTAGHIPLSDKASCFVSDAVSAAIVNTPTSATRWLGISRKGWESNSRLSMAAVLLICRGNVSILSCFVELYDSAGTIFH